MTEINTLKWIDYLVVVVMLSISTGIGIYYRFSGGRQKTVQEYFVANQSMSVVPVAIAMVASFTSAIGLLAISAENYMYGTQYVVINLSFLLSIPIVCYGFLPVFYNLQAMSIYEYLEKRFGVRARIMISFVNWIQLLLYSGMMLYAPSLALEATTGISKIASIIIIGFICALYSSIGGIKAVLTTDVFQILLIFTAMFLVIIIAANDVGGLGQIWEIARQGQRLQFDSVDLDPTVKYTWWSITLNGVCTNLILFGVNQVQIQRMFTVKNMQSSQRAMWLSWLITALMMITIYFSGLAMYSRYHNCDPLLKKRITSPDMLMPLYVMDTMSNISGLPGLFVAGIFSASLSTISSILNSMAAIMLEDFLKPIYRKCIGHEFPPKKSASVVKVLAFMSGIFSIMLAFLAQFFGGLFQAFHTIFGITGGPLLGVFTLGMGTQSATESGVIVGGLTAFSFLVWIAFGQPRPVSPKLPTTIDGCDNIVTNIITFDLRNVTNFSKSTGDSSYFYLYRISNMWYSPLGFLITFLLGLLVSNLSHLFIKNQNDQLDINLFFPVVARRIHSKRRNKTAIEESFSLDRRYSLSNVIHGIDDAAVKIHTKL
ncbi:PREDICTED: putative sodium-dependent multivitamin transporter [Wasmannia auropunctata]|uniref:putative sodium-dependent multivitamin transporter n=1 Tax=Wasmannia auropunctata TaxID=64793 RepID=UPI0005EFE184|nr:PREDICTED: putative sodium-dependent multivitamin transporter [Wasmannia auropunctata]